MESQAPPPITPPPPAAPELPEGVRREPVWPAWFAGVGFLAGMTGTLMFIGILAAITGADAETPEFVIIATVAQAIVFIGTAVGFASFAAKPKPWHFGLRRVPFGPALGWAAAGMGIFYVVAIAYGVAVQPDAEQEVTEALGADQGTLGLIVAGVMVMVVAPVAEEFFFRGFFYKALRSRFTWVAAALIDGLVFGIIHFDFSGADALLLLPPLALLGFIFCWVYEKTGSLFPVIGMHAFNNTVAFAAQADDGWRVSLVVGPLMLIACALAPRLLRPSPVPGTA